MGHSAQRGCTPISRRRIRILGVLLTSASVAACADVFNPSFLNLFDATGTNADVSFQALTLPSGHVPILFKNNARIADNVFEFLLQGAGDVTEIIDELQRLNPQLSREEIEAIVQSVIDGEPIDLEQLNVPPRVRLTVDVTFVNGAVQRLELLEGLRLARGEDLVSDFPPDVRENTADVFVAQCEIAAIQVVRVDAFIPVVVRVQRRVAETEDAFLIVCDRQIPQFDTLDPDQSFSQEEGTFTVLRNYDPRFFPPPLTSVQCGTVVVIQLSGDLSLPFEAIPAQQCPVANNPPPDNLAPGYFEDDVAALSEVQQIPGRYSVSLTTRGGF